METAIAMKTSTSIESPVLEIIEKRRSLRAYAQRNVEPEKIKSLFEAARWAPSSVNEQPWSYIYATKEQLDLWQKIFDALNEGNKTWVKEAPLLIVSLVKKTFSRSGRQNPSASYDVGGANAFLTLQATQLGLNVHQLGGFDPWVLRENLHVPDTHELGVVMAVGYAGDAAMLPENLKLRELAPRQRLVQEEFVMNKTF